MRKAAVGCLGAVVLVVAVGAVALHDSALGRVVQDIVNDSFVSCDELPSSSSLKDTLGRHAELVKTIEAIDPERVMMGVDSARCGDAHAEILIYYATQDQRERIESLLEHGGLGDAPATLRNW